jgi:hypothetical protein
VKAKKAAALEERRLARTKRRKDRTAGLIQAGAPIAADEEGLGASAPASAEEETGTPAPNSEEDIPAPAARISEEDLPAPAQRDRETS